MTHHPPATVWQMALQSSLHLALTSEFFAQHSVQLFKLSWMHKSCTVKLCSKTPDARKILLKRKFCCGEICPNTLSDLTTHFTNIIYFRKKLVIFVCLRPLDSSAVVRCLHSVSSCIVMSSSGVPMKLQMTSKCPQRYELSNYQ